MTGFLRNRLTAAATALAVGLGTIAATATPVFARNNDDGDVAKWILGLGAAAVILNQMDKNDNKSNARRYNTYDNRYYDNGYYDDRRTPDRNRYQTRALPGNCLIQVRTRDGRRDVISGNCLARETRRVDLPRSCAFDLITDHNRRETVYGRNCLEDRGYRIGQR